MDAKTQAQAIGERIKERRKALDLTQEQLTELCGWESQGRVSNYERGKRSPNYDDALKIAKALKSTVDQIIFGDTIPLPLSENIAIADYNAFVDIPMIDAFYHAGNAKGARLGKEPAFLKSLNFRADWIEYMGFDVSMLKVAMVNGKSMEPTLSQSDVILVDKRESHINEIENGAVYALIFKEKPLVKRVYVQEFGEVLLASDNPAFSDREFSEEEAKEIDFIGRVVWRGGEVN